MFFPHPPRRPLLLVVLLILGVSHVLGLLQVTPKSSSNPKTPKVCSVSLKQQDRASKAKKVWNTIAISPTPNRDEIISLDFSSKNVSVYQPSLFEEFSNSLRGTFFINGLSSCRIGRYSRQINPMESHGYVKSLAFRGDGTLQFKASVVRTPLAQKELRLQCPVARGVMSSLAGTETALSCLGNALAPSERDTANLVAILWPPVALKKNTNTTTTIEPMLIVAGDNGQPYCMDPKTMKSKGKLEWCIPELAQHIGGKKMMAHMRVDEKRQRLILCSTSFELRGEDKQGLTLVELMEFDTSFQLVSKRDFQTRFMVFHDWTITDNYYVLPKNPARIRWTDMARFIMGAKVGVDVFEMDEDAPGEFIFIPRHDNQARVKEVTANSFFNIFHMGPCYEDANGEVVIFANVFDRFRFGGEMGMQEFDPIQWSSGGSTPPPRLDKFVIDTSNNIMVSRERVPVEDNVTGYNIPVDMPTFHEDGRKTQYSYFAGALRPEGWFPFRSIVKIDLQEQLTWNWDAGDDCVVSEPTFIPRPFPETEDDGFVISIVHNAATQKCDLVVWESSTFHNGPIGTICLGELMPWCVHGSWSHGVLA